MGKYVLKRIGLAFITVFIILSLTYILVKLLPFERPLGDDSKQIAYFDKQYQLGYVYRFDRNMDDVYGEALYKSPVDKGKSNYYYMVPVLEQYVHWVKNIVTKWDWGVSKTFMPNVAASTIIMKRIGYTIRLNVFSVIFSVPLGIALGILAALKKNSVTDHFISTMVMVFISIPSFVLISFVVRLFAYNLGWLPSSWPPDTSPTKMKILGYIIPVFCLSFGSVCYYCRYIRAELCEVMESEYLLLARTKGLTRRQAIVRHALKNAMVPILPIVIGTFLGVMGGSMVLERIFAIPGVGDLTLKALSLLDYDLFVGTAMFYTLIGLLAGIVTDLSYGFLDPRIRMGER